MFLPLNYMTALVLMFITMLCWGSWANMAKVDTKWRFELFYWDYALGLFVTCLIYALTLGSFGPNSPSFYSNLLEVNMGVIWQSLLSGAIFNLANILLVAAINMAGMAVAFPVAVGLAVVLGTSLNYFLVPKGDPTLLVIGIFLILLAMLFSALAYRKKEKQFHNSSSNSKQGLVIALISGFLMSLFYPLLTRSMSSSTPLSPYSAAFFFGLGVFISNWIINYAFMKKPITGNVLYVHDYFKGSFKQHLWGFLGGFIWCTGFVMNLIASTNAGPAIAYAFGQGATLIAALWGVFIWKEFSKVSKVFFLLFMMFICYTFGLSLIGFAKLT